MIRPMPKEILIHSVIYEEYEEGGRYGDGFKEPIILENVLVQPVSALKRSQVSIENTFNSLMFFDCSNSIPSDVNFVKESRITFNGNSMVLNKVNPIYTFTLHHYELELI